MPSSDLWENVIFTKINTYYRYHRHTLCLQHQVVGMGSYNITNLVPYILTSSASLYTTNGAIYGRYKF